MHPWRAFIKTTAAPFRKNEYLRRWWHDLRKTKRKNKLKNKLKHVYDWKGGKKIGRYAETESYSATLPAASPAAVATRSNRILLKVTATDFEWNARFGRKRYNSNASSPTKSVTRISVFSPDRIRNIKRSFRFRFRWFTTAAVGGYRAKSNGSLRSQFFFVHSPANNRRNS